MVVVTVIMTMKMLVCNRLVRMFVIVFFEHEQPDTRDKQRNRYEVCRHQRFPEPQHGKRDPEKGRTREHNLRPRGTHCLR